MRIGSKKQREPAEKEKIMDDYLLDLKPGDKLVLLSVDEAEFLIKGNTSLPRIIIDKRDEAIVEYGRLLCRFVGYSDTTSQGFYRKAFIKANRLMCIKYKG